MSEENNKPDITTQKDLEQRLINYRMSATTNALIRRMNKKSFSDIYGVARKETSHSKFLAWLLDPKESHGLGQLPLKRLLTIVVRRGIEQNNNDAAFLNVKNTLLVADATYNEDFIDTLDVKVEVESYIQASIGHGRIDILIKGLKLNRKDVNIVIENKVASKEHHDQTKTYYAGITENYPGSDNLFIFLSPKFPSELEQQSEVSCACKSFVEITYQDILVYILEELLCESLLPETQFILEDYVHNLTSPNSDGKYNKIMAMTKEMQDTLKMFWEENRSLILSSVEALAMSGEPEAKKLLDSVTEYTRDYGKYQINGRGKEYGKRELVREVVKHIVEQHGGYDEQVKKELDSLCDKGVIRQKRDFESRRADKVCVNGQDIYVNNQWTKDNIQPLINNINKNKSFGLVITG